MSHQNFRDGMPEKQQEIEPMPDFDVPLLARVAEKGAEARKRGERRESCPMADDDYPVRGYRSAWLRGWDDSVKERVPNVRVPVVQVETRQGRYLPHDQPMPGTYATRAPVPCESCRCLLLPNLAQAVVCLAITRGVAYLRCRACGAQFKRGTKS